MNLDNITEKALRSYLKNKEAKNFKFERVSIIVEPLFSISLLRNETARSRRIWNLRDWLLTPRLSGD